MQGALGLARARYEQQAETPTKIESRVHEQRFPIVERLQLGGLRLGVNVERDREGQPDDRDDRGGAQRSRKVEAAITPAALAVTG